MAIPGPAASAPWELVRREILRPHIGAIELGTLGPGVRQTEFQQALLVVPATLKLEKDLELHLRITCAEVDTQWSSALCVCVFESVLNVQNWLNV